MNDDLLILLTDAVNELTLPRTHHEPVFHHDGRAWTRNSHSTQVPSLLDQLRNVVEPSSSSESGKSSFGSRSPARDEAIDMLLRIEGAAASWLGLRCLQPLRLTVEDNLRALVGCAPTLDPALRWDLTREARRWVTWARVTTGWEVPAFRPDNTCPLCARRGGLRVRAGDGVSSSEASATCVDCGEAWDPATIGLLAQHIRSENDDEAWGAA